MVDIMVAAPGLRAPDVIELVGKPTDPAHGAAVFVSMVDTPNGRLTLNCATRPDEIEGALNQFRSIRASITLPGATP